MEEFLKSVERRAFRMAELATHSSDDAIDILQDSMIALVKKYSDKPEDEWRPLFFRILQNRIKDWHRRTKVRNVWKVFWKDEDGEDNDPISQYADPTIKDQAEIMETTQSLEKVHSAIKTLPWRQRQTFLLRAWEEMSVSETAQAMNISEGSVKTHFSRATQALKNILGNSCDE